MKQLDKNYDYQKREKHWQEYWVEKGTYHFKDDQPRGQTFVIDTPPPTVSGVLHMGHIFSYTQADFIARYQRMSGKDVFYPMGFDDNGLPTERLVEKIKGVRGSSMPRAEFVALCREVVKDAEEEFRRLFKSAALSVDWRQEYQTISDDVRRLSQASFIDLLQKGEAYRDFRPTYWDWVDQTAIAQAEIENKEMPGVMNEIEFLLQGAEARGQGPENSVSTIPRSLTSEPLVIMTTRPELLGACVAVMYHPEDPNAAKYKGKYAITPLFGVKVPMIADEAVERDKGTGLVMCCTFGDDTDKEWVRKHELPTRPILQLNGWMRVKWEIENENIIAIDFFAGTDGTNFHSKIDEKNSVDFAKTISAYQVVYTSLFSLENDLAKENSARKEKILELLPTSQEKLNRVKKDIIKHLSDAGKLLKQTPMTHTVKCAERSGTPIEIIPTYQWFVRITDKKEALLAKGAEVNWHPEYMRIRLNQWIEGLKEDWCISRQRFFGVPFPVWFSKRAGEEGKLIYAQAEELPVDPMATPPKGYTLDEVEPSTDVMDTWATSSISPQIGAFISCGRQSRSTGSGANGKDPAQSLRASQDSLFPADLRPQAHEIIRTWAFYTIAKAYLHADTIPWKNIVISGWCLAADKTKMSKSKGNVVTPVALIEEKGTDAVRYWASTSRLGTDTAFSEDLLKIGRKLVNKIWNASQFAALNLDKLSGRPTTAAQDAQSGIISEALDMWILSRLNQCVSKATKAFEAFEYCDARVAIEDFFWNDFCDNYLELVKARAYGSSVEFGVWSTQRQQSALYTIYHCLDALLRLFAPFVPHVTEELYSHIFEEKFVETGSVHARGNWPSAGDYPYDARAEKSGVAAVDVLNVIRKAKSEANVSIKFPVDEVGVTATGDGAAWEDLADVLDDLKAAGNAQDIAESASGDLQYISEQGWYRIGVKLAA